MVASEHPYQTSRTPLAITDANQDTIDNRGPAVDSVSPAPMSLHPVDGPTALYVRATIKKRECPRFCHCRCHVQTQLNPPRWMKSIFGTFFGSFRGYPLLHSRSCDYSECRQSKECTAQVLYVFPWWFVKRAIVFCTTWKDLSGPGASWTFRMPRVINTRSDIWSLIKYGSLSRVRECLEMHEASLYDVAEDGWTLLHVRISSPFSIWVTLIPSLRARDSYASQMLSDPLDYHQRLVADNTVANSSMH